MKNLFFIHRFPFNKEIYIQNEFDFFKKQGYNVKYLDISSLLKKTNFELHYPKEIADDVILFQTKKEFTQFIAKHKKHTLIISEVSFIANSAWMYKAIFKADIPYLIFDLSSVIAKFKIKKRKSISEKLKALKTKILKLSRPQKLIKKPGEIVQLYGAKKCFKPAKVIFTSKTKLSSGRRVLIGKNTKLLYANSADYRTAMALPNTSLSDDKYAVFIDQFLPYHPDFQSNYTYNLFQATDYYNELNRFFKTFTQQTGLKVIVAAHPRRLNKYDNDFNSDIQLFYNQTGHLVKNAEMVLLHYSTAINFAIIFNKPMLFIDSNLFNGIDVFLYTRAFSKHFNSTIVNMSNNSINCKQINKVDTAKYQNYLEQNIQHKDAQEIDLKNVILQAIEEYL